MKLTITTNHGNIGIEVYPDKAPITVENFLGYVNSGFYRNTLFHRTVPNFVIQGGGFNVNGDAKWPRQPAIPNEANNGLYNIPYSIAMARLNEAPDSATCEFFINVVENMALNYQDPEFYPGYCVFGQVISGFDVVNAISNVPTQTRGPYTHLPTDPVIIIDINPTGQNPVIEPIEEKKAASDETPAATTASLNAETAPANPAVPIQQKLKDEGLLEHPTVRLSTKFGDIDIALFPDKAPVTVENFLQYVKDEFYVGTIFHRVIEHFVIQGGGYNYRLNEKRRRPTIKYEGDNGLTNKAYTIAMARAQSLDSASSEFYINLIDNEALDHENRQFDTGGYCVFGMVIDGFDVVDRIGQVEVESKGIHEHVPVEPIVIEKMYLLSDEETNQDA